MWQLFMLAWESHKDDFFSGILNGKWVSFPSAFSVTLICLMDRNQGIHFWLSCCLFSLLPQCLGEVMVKPLPAPRPRTWQHRILFDRKASYMPSLLQKLYFLCYGRILWVWQFQDELETLGLVAGRLKEGIKEYINTFIHSLTKYLLNVYYVLASVYRGYNAKQNRENICFLRDYSVSKWMPDMQGYFLLHNFVLHIRSLILLRSLSAVFQWKIPSVSPVRCQLKWWSHTQKGRRSSTLINFKLLVLLKVFNKDYFFLDLVLESVFSFFCNSFSPRFLL